MRVGTAGAIRDKEPEASETGGREELLCGSMARLVPVSHAMLYVLGVQMFYSALRVFLQFHVWRRRGPWLSLSFTL